jgi:predicted  nucleic acid-binding Zn-ribbon protein
MPLSKLNTELEALQAKFEDREEGVKILTRRLSYVQHAYDHFDNSAHDDQNFLSEFETFLEECNPDLNETLRNEFGSNYYHVLKATTSENNFNMQYTEFVDNLSHDNFDEYKRLAEVIEAIEERISEREDQASDLEDQVWDKEIEIEDFEI